MTLPRSGIGHDVLFAHGRVSVLQQHLLARPDIDRLLGAHDLHEVARIFTELKFSNRIDQGISDPDVILDAIAVWVRDEALGMAPEKFVKIFDVLWLEGDVPLLAYLLKKRLGLTSAISRIPTPAITAFPPQAWQALVEHGTSNEIPASAVSCVQEALSQKSPTPAVIDAIAAQWGAKYQVEITRKSGSPLIVSYVRHQIDLQNIRTALRALDLPKEEREAMLLHGGTLPLSAFCGTKQDLQHAIEVAEIGFTLTGEIQNGDHRELEQSLSAVLAEDIAALWNVPLKIDQIFAFAAIALSQLRLLRTILLAKRAGFSPQETKHVLPPFLPATHYIL